MTLSLLRMTLSWMIKTLLDEKRSFSVTENCRKKLFWPFIHKWLVGSSKEPSGTPLGRAVLVRLITGEPSGEAFVIHRVTENRRMGAFELWKSSKIFVIRFRIPDSSPFKVGDLTPCGLRGLLEQFLGSLKYPKGLKRLKFSFVLSHFWSFCSHRSISRVNHAQNGWFFDSCLSWR